MLSVKKNSGIQSSKVKKPTMKSGLLSPPVIQLKKNKGEAHFVSAAQDKLIMVQNYRKFTNKGKLSEVNDETNQSDYS